MLCTTRLKTTKIIVSIDNIHVYRCIYVQHIFVLVCTYFRLLVASFKTTLSCACTGVMATETPDSPTQTSNGQVLGEDVIIGEQHVTPKLSGAIGQQTVSPEHTSM